MERFGDEEFSQRLSRKLSDLLAIIGDLVERRKKGKKNKKLKE